jgi:glycosyltransferase 2 family protein
VKLLRQGWRVGWRLIVCAVLLVWIGQSIFSSEAQATWRAAGRDWTALTRFEQWRAAWSIGPQALWETLTLVRPMALVASLGFMGATLLLGVWRWRLVLRVHGLNLPLGRALQISLIAHFFNAFLLGSTGGDVLKAYYAARETHHKKTAAVVTVLADRLIGLVAMLVFAGVMMLVNLRFLLGHGELALVVWVVVGMLAACGGLLALAFWGGVSRALPQARAWLRRLPKADLLEKALEAFRSFGRDRVFLRQAFGISLLVNVACVLQLMSLGTGLGLEVPWLVWFVIVPTIICISALPITPSGLGVRENLYVLTLAGAGLQVPATHALAVSLLAYFGFLAWSLVGGVVYLLVRERQHLKEMMGSGEPPNGPGGP